MMFREAYLKRIEYLRNRIATAPLKDLLEDVQSFHKIIQDEVERNEYIAGLFANTESKESFEKRIEYTNQNIKIVTKESTMELHEYISQIKSTISDAEKNLSTEDYAELIRDVNFETSAIIHFLHREDESNG